MKHATKEMILNILDQLTYRQVRWFNRLGYVVRDFINYPKAREALKHQSFWSLPVKYRVALSRFHGEKPYRTPR